MRTCGVESERVPLDIERLRRETAGCRNVIHFDNAGAALMADSVYQTVTDHLGRERRVGGYRAADEARVDFERVYASAARLLGCDSDEIAVVENATRAWDMAFYAIPLGEGDRILTGRAEYCSNYIAMTQVCARTGATIEVIPDDDAGQVSIEVLERTLDERVKLIALTHVPMTGGLVNPAAAVGRVARAAGVPFLLDACQSVGQLPVDVRAIGCDLLTATSRKYLRGPRGVGFLYARREFAESLEPPFLDVHAIDWEHWTPPGPYAVRTCARRFENWEANYAGKLGMGTAIDYALALGIQETYALVQALAADLRVRLTDIPGVRVQDNGTERCGIVSFTVADRDPVEIAHALAARKVNVSGARGLCTPLDLPARGLTQGIVRASVHYYNTADEVERFCSALASLDVP